MYRKVHKVSDPITLLNIKYSITGPEWQCRCTLTTKYVPWYTTCNMFAIWYILYGQNIGGQISNCWASGDLWSGALHTTLLHTTIPFNNINSLASRGFGCNFKNLIFKLASLIGTFRASFYEVLRWMIQDLTDDKSTLVQVMVWCHQATSHYLSQWWPKSMLFYGVIRPQ